MKDKFIISVMVICTIIVILFRFVQPELTETQLFIKYWYTYLSYAIIMYGGAKELLGE